MVIKVVNLAFLEQFRDVLKEDRGPNCVKNAKITTEHFYRTLCPGIYIVKVTAMKTKCDFLIVRLCRYFKSHQVYWWILTHDL